jgi:protein-S-isoprenylcysteine O-methyltransferase Ste14
MTPWIGDVTFALCMAASIAIRVPHDKVSQSTQVVETRKGILEKVLLSLVLLAGLVLPVLSFTPLLSFADYALLPPAFGAGIASMGLSLWLFYWSHSDLGRNWSASLEIREGHKLVVDGVYRAIRHPMYTSIFLLSLGQVFLLANWIAGPAMLIVFSAMFVSRLSTEEKLMLDRFGLEYEAYRRKTKRIIPGVW